MVKNPLANAGRHKGHRFDPWGGKISWRRAWQPTPVLLPEESYSTEELQSTVYRPWQATVYRVAQSDRTKVT